jgi:hypothetical protein
MYHSTGVLGWRRRQAPVGFSSISTNLFDEKHNQAYSCLIHLSRDVNPHNPSLAIAGMTLLCLATGDLGWRRRQAPVGISTTLSSTKNPCSPLLLHVLVFWVLGKITCNFANKCFYQDTSSLFLGDWALGFGGDVQQDLFRSLVLFATKKFIYPGS